MASYVMFHPKRKEIKLEDYTIYVDHFTGNQDPFVWNKKFLHSFCKMTQYKSTDINLYNPNTDELGDIIFWVEPYYENGEKVPSKFLCDLVFVVDEACIWHPEEHEFKSKNRDKFKEEKLGEEYPLEAYRNYFDNKISCCNPILINDEYSFKNHYSWINEGRGENKNKKGKVYHWWAPGINRKRITLKAHPTKSFQPLESDKRTRIDIKSLMEQLDLDTKIKYSGTTISAMEIEDSKKALNLYKLIHKNIDEENRITAEKFLSFLPHDDIKLEY